MIVVVIVVVVVAVAVAVVIRTGLVRRSRSGKAATSRGMRLLGPEQVEAVPVAADGEDHYAAGFLVRPGRCFRLCRDSEGGVAYPCERPVVGRGEFEDHRGNVVNVEACAVHKGVLGAWRDQSDRPGHSGVPGIGDSDAIVEVVDGPIGDVPGSASG